MKTKLSIVFVLITVFNCLNVFASNYLYVTNRSTQSITYFDAETGAYQGVFSTENINIPNDMDFGADGNLYMSNRGSGGGDNIVKFDINTGESTVFATSSIVSSPYGLEFGPDGNLYVANSQSNTISVLDGTTGALLRTIGSSSELNMPFDITFGADGNLYVANYSNTNIIRYNPTTGNMIDTFAVGTSTAYHGMVFGPDGNLYVSDWDSNTIERFNGTTGAYMGAFISTNLSGPWGMEFNDGYLYIANYSGSYISYHDATTGQYLGTFTTGGGISTPACLIFTQDAEVIAVPEPASMVLLGVSLLCMFRKKLIG